MDKFVTKTKRQRTTNVLELPSVSSIPSSQVPPPSSNTDVPQVVPSIPALTLPQQATYSTVQDEFSVWNLQSDPAMRKPILSYHPNDQDKIRRAHMKMGPCQPKNFPFPQKLMGKKNRRFNEACFLKHGSWLEYSISKDVVFCLPCYLFRNYVTGKGGSDAFVNACFSNWKQQVEKLDKHVGCQNSTHNDASSVLSSVLSC
ncbi:zinc finger MYM-type protein 5-like [Papaver somniferum]|uniref:zinc finger MYM-type protein 5-like n=1 Tax=Papaver somniferum TaxID=3469 RepID=UPI000E6F94BC|nr:zinc finger MYM-type protein 5-like [Papaver somniferum]